MRSTLFTRSTQLCWQTNALCFHQSATCFGFILKPSPSQKRKGVQVTLHHTTIQCGSELSHLTSVCYIYSRTPLNRINWDSEISRYAHIIGFVFENRLHICLCTKKPLIHNSLYIFDNWGKKCKVVIITVRKCLPKGPKRSR